MSTKRRRKYTIQRYYAVICDVCNEDITDRPSPTTKEEAEEARDVHEAQHAHDDALESS